MNRKESEVPHHAPLKAECIDDILHALDHPVVLAANSLATLDLRPFRTIENKEWQERCTHELRALEEQRSQLGVLAFPAVGCMVEPNASVYADAETTDAVRVSFEAIDDSEVCERACLPSRAKDLVDCQRTRWTRTAEGTGHARPTGQQHPSE